MFKKNIDTLIIAAIFVVMARVLEAIQFWQLIGLPSPEGFIFQGLMFLVLVAVLYHSLFEPYLNIAQERFVQTDEKKRIAETKRREADQMIQSYEQSILQARLDAFKQRERIALEGELEEKKLIEAAKQNAKMSIEAAMVDVAKQVEAAKSQLSQSSEKLVQQLIDEILAPRSSKSASISHVSETRM